LNTKELKDKVKIEDIISQYIKIERDSNYSDMRAQCPFHEGDQNPSFSVNGVKQLFYCFGCKKGGDVFKFVEYIDKINFQESIKRVAKLAGIEVELGDLDLLNQITEYYHEQINLPRGIKFLDDREIPDEMAIEFKLGYANENLYALYNAFPDFKQQLIDLNFIDSKYAGTVNEINPSRFSNRIMIPITSNIGTIGFSGRTLIDSEDKYKNIKNNRFFNRREMVFGLPQARKSIIEMGNCYLVEGFLGKIRMHQRHYFNTVSIFGSALTIEQARLIRRYTNKVTFLFDGDEGGFTACMFSAKSCIMAGLDFDILILPDGLDPDDYLKKSKNKIETLDSIDKVIFLKEVFIKSDILDCVEKADNIEKIPVDIIDGFKINLDMVRKNRTTSIVKNYNMKNLTKFSHMLMLIESHPKLEVLLTDEERVEIDKEKNNMDLLENIIDGNNFYTKVKDPEKLFNTMRNSK